MLGQPLSCRDKQLNFASYRLQNLLCKRAACEIKVINSLSATNGWATGFVLVTGDTDSDVQRCAGSLRAAGVRKVEVQLIPRKVGNPYE